ncbi:MAG: hypothetical protein R3F50_17015 [Gammaproteobacteria bacterium]
MPTKPITERQQHWLDHLNSAAANGSSIVEYAKLRELKAKDLYAWKTRLINLGHLPASHKQRGFVPVVPVVSMGNAASATLVMPNGFRLELQGRVDSVLLQDLMNAARQVS